MAFTSDELNMIEESVGKFCERRTLPALKHNIRLMYEIEHHTVTIYEERPRWNDPSSMIKYGKARFRFSRNTGLWTIFWMRANLKWNVFPPIHPTHSLQELVDEVDKDSYHAFFG